MFGQCGLHPAFKFPSFVVLGYFDDVFFILAYCAEQAVEDQQVTEVNEEHLDVACPEQILESGNAGTVCAYSEVDEYEQVDREKYHIHLMYVFLYYIRSCRFLDFLREHRAVGLRKYE